MALDGEDLMRFPELANDLEVRMQLCQGDGSPQYYPPGLLPVAVGHHDDLLLLRLDGPDAGAVYFSYDPEGYCEWHCHRVAGSVAELLRELDAVGLLAQASPVSPEELGALVHMINDERISGKQGKEVLVEMFKTGKTAAAVIEERGFVQVSDTGEIDRIVDEVKFFADQFDKDPMNQRFNQ